MSNARIADLDRRLVAEARQIKVLTWLAWPIETGTAFLESWSAGRPRLPTVEYPRVSFSDQERRLEAVMEECDRSHPLEDYLFRTARSYAQAASMLALVGTRGFGERSRSIYGHPGEPVAGDDVSTFAAASRVMESTAPFVRSCGPHEEDFCVLPSTVAAEMERQAAVFDDNPVRIVVDTSLASKAAAGARQVRLRGGTCYSEADVPQLVQHELLVHTLTALNGQLQPTLTAFGLGAPRTTRTQEGLAIFAELITNSMDVHRLRRIAARVVAIDMALRGADFIEVFRYFLESGQTLAEAFSSAQRVFRGAELCGGSAFTKDGVYFQGLVRVHRFLRDAAREGRAGDPGILMAGRMHTADVARLAPWFASGVLAPARYLPPWIRTRSRLVAFLLYSSVAAELHLDSLLAQPELPSPE